MAATAAQTDKARPLLWTLAGRFLLVALLPILTMALLFYLYYAPLMRSAVEQRQQLAADTTAQQLQRHFSIANRELSSLLKFAAMITPTASGSSGRARLLPV